MNGRMWLTLVMAGGFALSAAGAEGDRAAGEPAQRPDPYDAAYRGYDAGFAGVAGLFGWDRFGEKMMKLSSEPSFFTLTLVPESDRAYALVTAAKEKEAQDRFADARAMYQKVIDEYPDMLYRVSPDGVFVPIAHYCQLRILGFPANAVRDYRVLYDPRAREAYETARQKNSLDGLAEIRDKMLGTSYGGRSLLTLGMSALDRGHYLEALEYFEQVWEHFPDRGTRGAELAMSMALCRKMLGMGMQAGERYGLVGHWKLDDGSGNKAADSSGWQNHGIVTGNRQSPPQWIPGRIGGALHFNETNGVIVPARSSMNVGVGGTDFSVAFWLYLDGVWYDHGIFFKGPEYGSAGGRLSLNKQGSGQLLYTIATQSPTWETGAAKSSLPVKRWVHVAFVKAGDEVKVFLDGKLDVRQTLKAPVLGNMDRVSMGTRGSLDDVRLYNRALLDREVAEFAGAVGTAAMTASARGGEAPLTVEFSCPAAGDKVECLWEFGDGERATGPKAKHTYLLGGEHTAVLTVTEANGAVSVARAKIAVTWPAKDADFARTMGSVLDAAEQERPPWMTQLASAPHSAADDYTLLPPTRDPLGLQAPVWEESLPGGREEIYAYTQPLLTPTSVLYRHKNIVYCRSILNGVLRWKSDLGGRVTWQNWGERQYPQEDILVQDGLVFTPMHKVGPTLAALDEITGQLKWAYGPMVASTEEQAKLRFEAAPAGGPQTVYAGYVLDNVEGDTHTDTEYGVIAFESVTGRIKWRQPICTLRPGKFSAGFAVKRRNKIRSFTSPPLYHEGTVYYCTNAGTIVALDALSGRINWLMKYPYYVSPDTVHDATRQFGSGGGAVTYTRRLVSPHEPMFWYNQRPLLIGENLFVLPVDTPLMFSLDRRTGKVAWSKMKEVRGPTYFLGPTSSGDLVLAYSNYRKEWPGKGFGAGAIHLVDPKTGKTSWESGDLVEERTQPFLNSGLFWRMGVGTDGSNGVAAFEAFRWHYMTTARPFLSSDNRVCVTGYVYVGYPFFTWVSNLAVVDLNQRKVLDRRNYLDGVFMVVAGYSIKNAPEYLKVLEDIPHKDDKITSEIAKVKALQTDTVPVNPYGPFIPFSRVTKELYGVTFELRTTARSVAMVYDREAVKKALAGGEDPASLLAKAELATGESRLEEAAGLMKQCLSKAPSEAWDFRALVNQQLYQVHRRLAQGGVRSGQKDVEMSNCLGMSQTVNSREEEMETLLALSEAYERQGDYRTAALMAQMLVNRYGQYEYPVPSMFAAAEEVRAGSGDMLGKAEAFVGQNLYRPELDTGIGLAKKGLGLYFSALTPLKKDLRMRAGELGARRLLALQKAHEELAKDMERDAVNALANRGGEEALQRLWEFPGTVAAQKVVDRLLEGMETGLRKANTSIEEAARLRKGEWAVADAARICGLKLPDEMKGRLLAPETGPKIVEVAGPMEERTVNLDEERGPSWLVLERKGQGEVERSGLFLGGRVKKRLDNKFLLTCMDPASGKVLWNGREKRGEQWLDELRLQGKGDEPGFFEAFVFQDIVVTHGRYDVLAFDLKDGKQRWRYLVPFDFEIRYVEMGGDLLVLAGDAETIALYLGTKDPQGEVVWEEKEEGDLYVAPYFVGDRLVAVRKMPFNVTVRYRSTGKLMGRLAVPDLQLFDEHPLIENGPRALPVSHEGKQLAVTDGWYYLMLDVEQMRVVWKRLIDANDMTRLPPMRLEVNGDYLAVVKQDYDVKAIYMLSSRTGEVLWKTDPKVPTSPQPIDSMLIRDGKLYGIKPHPGQGFYFVGMDCKTGKDLFRLNEQTGYGGKPEVRLRHELYGNAVVAEIKDRQDFELKAFDVTGGKVLHTVKVKGAGELGEHGCASATTQNGQLALLGKNELRMAVRKQETMK